MVLFQRTPEAAGTSGTTYQEIETTPPTPSWFVTFADMMTLLLAFFVMLAAMHELGHGEAKREALSAIQRELHGPAVPPAAPARPRDPALHQLLTAGWSQREPTPATESLATAETVKNNATRAGAPTERTISIPFAEDSSQLSDLGRESLRQVSREYRRLSAEHPRIEIRAIRRETPAGPAASNRWLARDWERCGTILQHLTHQEQLAQGVCQILVDTDPHRHATTSPGEANAVEVVLVLDAALVRQARLSPLPGEERPVGSPVGSRVR